MKVVLMVLLLAAVATAGYAQVATNPIYNSEHPQTNFSNIGVWGTESTGNPGYLVLKGCENGASNGVSRRCFAYFLYVDGTGDLRLASYADISAYSSFPSGDWNSTNMPAGSVVGSQS